MNQEQIESAIAAVEEIVHRELGVHLFRHGMDGSFTPAAGELASELAPLFAAAKAEALREAADHLEPSGVIWWGDEGAQVQEEGYPIRLTKLPDWLRARADNLTT